MPHICNLTNPSATSALTLNKHNWLHPEGYRLIKGWFDKAWAQRDDDEPIFESFIFAWFAVNSWAACVTGEDGDRIYVQRLSRDAGLQRRFKKLLDENAQFKNAVQSFHGMWPIFKAQQIRRAGVQAGPELSRQDVVAHYFDAGVTEFAPACWLDHRSAGEAVPINWAHTLEALYRVRCNLFHGEKSAHSEMDRAIVRAAFDTLVLFFRGAEIL